MRAQSKQNSYHILSTHLPHHYSSFPHQIYMRSAFIVLLNREKNQSFTSLIFELDFSRMVNLRNIKSDVGYFMHSLDKYLRYFTNANI